MHTNESFWLKRARREMWRFNFGWWLQLFLPWVVGLGLAGAAGLLALRSADAGLHWAALAGAAGLLAGLATALVLARKRFLSVSETLTRLDADLHLHTRLTAASQGVGGWPAPQPDAALALRWKWGSLLWPPAAALALVFLAWHMPLPAIRAAAVAARAEPPAWTALQEKIDALRQAEVVQPESVNELQQALDALRKQSSNQWFRHESLEAGDQLQSQADQALAALQKNLETALGAAEAARQIETSQLQELQQPLNDALNQALQGLEMGKLPLDEKMLGQLKNLDVSKMRQLSAEQWKALQEKMKQGISTCSACLGEGNNKGEEMVLLQAMAGRGGVDRGPGAAPLTMKEETHLDTTKADALSNDDLSRAAMGDMTGMGTGRHKVDDTSWTGPQSGGAMSSAGSGGDAVWEQTATPQEQEALRRFFQ